MNQNPVDKKQVARAFSRAAEVYDRQAGLQKQVAEQLVEKLEFIKHQPGLILDIGAGTGFLRKPLLKRYKKSRLILTDLSQGMLRQARRNDSLLFSRSSHCCADMEQLPMAADSVDMVISSLALQWSNDLDRVMAEIHRVLKPGGLLMFSTLGPDTLKELRQVWQSVDADAHVNVFLDMHDIGDCMVRTGLSGPVMDVDYYTLTYDKPMDVMRDLKTLGSSNHLIHRGKSLKGRGVIRRVAENYESFRRDGKIPSTYEVVFGHAWCPEKKQYSRDGDEVGIPIRNLGRMS